MAMDIGQMRHRISLKNPAAPSGSNTDSYGGYTESLSNLSPATVWAAIQPIAVGSIERLVGNTVEGKLTHLVTIRYHSGVNTKTQITYGSRTLYVRGVRNIDELGEKQLLACEEVVS